MSGRWKRSEERVKLFPFSFLVGGSIALFGSTATERVSAVSYERGHSFEVGFLAPPALRSLGLCHLRSLREGVSGVAGVSTLSFFFFFSLRD